MLLICIIILFKSLRRFWALWLSCVSCLLVTFLPCSVFFLYYHVFVKRVVLNITFTCQNVTETMRLKWLQLHIVITANNNIICDIIFIPWSPVCNESFFLKMNISSVLNSDPHVSENFYQIKIFPSLVRKIPPFVCLVFKIENKF